MDTQSYLEKRFAKESSIVSRKIAGEFILVPIRRTAGDIDHIYAINEVAGRIWELIDGTRQLKDIRDILVDEYDVNPEEAEGDIVEFLQQLEQLSAVKDV